MRSRAAHFTQHISGQPGLHREPFSKDKTKGGNKNNLVRRFRVRLTGNPLRKDESQEYLGLWQTDGMTVLKLTRHSDPHKTLLIQRKGFCAGRGAYPPTTACRTLLSGWNIFSQAFSLRWSWVEACRD